MYFKGQTQRGEVFEEEWVMKWKWITRFDASTVKSCGYQDLQATTHHMHGILKSESISEKLTVNQWLNRESIRWI